SFDRLRRRDFITLLGGAATAWPLAAQAQQPGLPPDDLIGAPSDQYGRFGPFHHDNPAFSRASPRRSTFVESSASRFASSTVARRDRHTEKSDIAPDRRTLHRLCTSIRAPDARTSTRPNLIHPELRLEDKPTVRFGSSAAVPAAS